MWYPGYLEHLLIGESPNGDHHLGESSIGQSVERPSDTVNVSAVCSNCLIFASRFLSFSCSLFNWDLDRLVIETTFMLRLELGLLAEKIHV